MNNSVKIHCILPSLPDRPTLVFEVSSIQEDDPYSFNLICLDPGTVGMLTGFALALSYPLLLPELY